MFARRLLHHHSRPRWTVRTAAPAAVLNAAAANARATLALTLAAFGVINVIDSLGGPWSSLVTTLLLALLALAFFVAAQHSHDQHFGWLLSASVATGLAIADFYNLINVAPAASAAVLVTFIAIVLLVLRCLTRQPRRWPRATGEVPSGATHGLLEQQIEQAAHAAAPHEARDAADPVKSAAEARDS